MDAPDEFEAVYNYHDAEGNVLYQVVRFPGKKFRCRRPVGDGWQWGMGNVKRVLYNLPSLIEHPEETVYLVEGEKDADRLISLGLLATTNVHGAGKWHTSYTETLAGRDVVILPDNDEPGEKHASKVASYLKGVAASVKVVRLPDLPEHGDVSDWLSSGHTLDDLLSVVRSTNGLQATPKRKNGEATVRDYVIEEFVPRLANLVGEQNRLFVETERGWVRMSPRRLTREIIEYVKATTGEYPDFRKATELAKLVSTMVCREVDYAEVPCISFEDRVVTLDPSSGRLAEGKPEGVYTHLPCKFVDDPKPERWLRFLSEVMPDENSRDLLQEFLGLGLFVNFNPQKALVLFGPGANGKTALLKIITSLFPTGYVSSLNVISVADQKLLDSLDGALFNFSEETLSESIISSACFKAVTGDSLLMVNPKWQLPYQISPTAQWIIASNHLPSFDEATEALHRRLLFLPMETVIPMERRRPVNEIIAEVKPERDHVIGWFLKGAQRWFAQMGFSYSDAHQRSFDTWKVENSPILLWLRDEYHDPEGLLKTYYDSFRSWCRENGFRQMSTRSFSSRLRSIGCKVTRRSNGMWVSLPKAIRGTSSVFDDL